MKNTIRTEVGPFEDKVAITQHFADGTSQAHLFTPEAATELAQCLMQAVAVLSSSGGWKEDVKVMDSVSIGLVSKGEEDEKKKIQ